MQAVNDEGIILLVSGAVILASIMVSWFISTNKERSSALILLEFIVSDRRQTEYSVNLAGRPEGLWSWLLNLFGLGTTVRFDITSTSIQRRIQTPSSLSIDAVPIKNVASVNSGYQKTALYLGIALFLTSITLMGAIALFLPQRIVSEQGPILVGTIISAFLAVVFFGAYYFSKRLLLQVETSGGRFIGIAFRPGIVNGFDVDTHEVARIIKMIQSLSQH